MIGILIAAGSLGIIIAVMDDGDMPAPLPLICSSLAIGLSTLIAQILLPESLALLSIVIGALIGGCAINLFQGMSVKRSCIAASIYLAVRMGVALVLF